MHAPQRVVLAHGCFDGLHLGHIRHLQEAREQGDRLVVSVTDDPFVRKGMGRPRFTARERVEALSALACVDHAFVSNWPSAVEIIKAVKPEVYVKGCDYQDADDAALAAEVAAVEAHGGRLFLTKSDKISSSRLINADRYGSPVADYLRSARERGFCDKIKTAIKKADELSIVFVGETILDEYIYVGALGKPSKEFMLATVEKKREQFLGGIVAAASHCEWQGARYVSQTTPLTKTRYVDEDFTKKLFEVYSAQRLELHDDQRAKFTRDLLEVVCADVVVVMDFGHGLIEEPERRLLEAAPFLAVNAQTNAGNVGFNPVTLYKHADLVCVDEPEARFAAGMPVGMPEAAMYWLLEKARASSIVVTRGRNGAMAAAHGDGHSMPMYIPAFTLQVTDTIGAGDAFLATAAPLVAAGLELEAAAFCGNVAGAIKTTIVGHRTHVTRDDLVQNIEALLA